MPKATRSHIIVTITLVLLAWLSSWPVKWEVLAQNPTVPTRTPTPLPATDVPATHTPKPHHPPANTVQPTTPEPTQTSEPTWTPTWPVVVSKTPTLPATVSETPTRPAGVSETPTALVTSAVTATLANPSQQTPNATQATLSGATFTLEAAASPTAIVSGTPEPRQTSGSANALSQSSTPPGTQSGTPPGTQPGTPPLDELPMPVTTALCLGGLLVSLILLLLPAGLIWRLRKRH